MEREERFIEEKFGRRTPFKVPEGYFDDFASQLMQSLPESEDRPAAKVVARKIHPMKTGSEVRVEEIVGKLQEVLRGTPPPWLRKAMNKGSMPSFLED